MIQKKVEKRKKEKRLISYFNKILNNDSIKMKFYSIYIILNNRNIFNINSRI